MAKVQTDTVKTPLKYIIYARKSDENKDKQVASIDKQLEICRGIAKAKNLEVVKEITEEKSARRANARQGFAEMIRLIERGEHYSVPPR